MCHSFLLQFCSCLQCAFEGLGTLEQKLARRKEEDQRTVFVHGGPPDTTIAEDRHRHRLLTVASLSQPGGDGSEEKSLEHHKTTWGEGPSAHEPFSLDQEWRFGEPRWSNSWSHSCFFDCAASPIFFSRAFSVFSAATSVGRRHSFPHSIMQRPPSQTFSPTVWCPGAWPRFPSLSPRRHLLPSCPIPSPGRWPKSGSPHGRTRRPPPSSSSPSGACKSTSGWVRLPPSRVKAFHNLCASG